MEKILNIYQRINAIMKEVNYIKKESKKVNNQYTFVSHDAVTAALQGPLANHGIIMVPTVAELIQDGNRTAIKMEISFVNVDDPSDRIVVYHWGYGIDTQDKGIGKAISYAVKYALLKMFCLETGDDVEKDSIEHVPQQTMMDQEIVKKNLNTRKKQILDLAGKDNKDDLIVYIDKIKQTFKSKKEEEIFLEIEAEDFIKNFFCWKENKAKVA